MRKLLFLLLLSTSALAQDRSAFERILVPVLVPPANGAFGSVFVTRLTFWNKSEIEPLQILGLMTDRSAPIEVPPFTETTTPPTVPFNGTPGRFMYVFKERVADLAANLRVFDSSRAATNFGTEVPLVREREFARRIILPDVPMDDKRFRKTLRIYSDAETTVNVFFHGPAIIGSPTIGPPPGQTVTLRRANSSDPAYAEFTSFPFYGFPLAVIVEPATLNDPASLWAFVSVTNNETQHITTITPQP